MVTHRLPSIGTFGTSLEPQYLFGSIPRNVKLAGLAMDVDRISTLSAAKDDDAQKDITFFRTTGPRKSAFEHLIPERLFSTPTQPAQAVSAVKALSIAASQGQKIYTLTKTNAAQLNNLTISQAAKNEIAAALNANKEVTVHQGQITYAGWAGEGYIILDPTTGAGAYKISGGGNGGFINDDDAAILSFIGLAVGLIGVALSAPLLTAAGIIISLVLIADQMLDFVAIQTRCGDLGYLFLISIIAGIIALRAGAAADALMLLVIAMYFGNAPIAIAEMSVCQ